MDITGIFSESFWYIAPILVSLTTAITGLINQAIATKWEEPAWLKQLTSWVIGSGVACAAWGLKFITFGQPIWLGVVALCVTVGLASNGIYDIPFIKSFVDKWFVKK